MKVFGVILSLLEDEEIILFTSNYEPATFRGCDQFILGKIFF